MIQTVQRELWEVVHFESVPDAELALAKFFVDYNHRRAHLGIGSLIPADRFYGRWPEVVAEMDAVSRRRQGGLALQLIVVGDQAELHLGGRRIVLGRVEP